MRFLDTTTGQFVEQDSQGAEYAILSHTWDHGGEQTFQDLRRIQERYVSNARRSIQASEPYDAQIDDTTRASCIWADPDLSPKIRDACAVARANGFRLLWIDSCCIDKTSSAELSEAINSMYAWYSRAEVCYAYLFDVPPQDDHWANRSRFRQSSWFRRGWTLQELVAPFEVIILSKDWKVIASKRDLVDLIEEITNISAEALLHEISLDKYSVAQRLSWASRRKTTRVEDQAYSLLGMFDIHMPTLYGEGERAFRRLQEAIMQRISDQSLFAWWMIYDLSEIEYPPLTTTSEQHNRQFVCSRNSQDVSILARSPFDFAEVSSIVAISYNEVYRRLRLPQLPVPEYTFTPHGIRTRLPVIPLSLLLSPNATYCPDEHPLPEWYLVILGCESAHHPGHLLGRVCNIPPSESGVELLYSGLVKISRSGWPRHRCLYPNLFPLSSATIERCRPHIELKTVYITHPDRENRTLQEAQRQPHKVIRLILLRRARDALRARGYTAELRGPDDVYPTTHWLTLSTDTHIITVEFCHTLERDGGEFNIRGNVTVSRPGVLKPSLAGPGVGPTRTWQDTSPWNFSLPSHEVDVAVSDERVRTVKLGLILVRRSYYSLEVEVLNDRDIRVAWPWGSWAWGR
ncbi:HET-domain-containing protein [Ganoderma leucocontextum]|nr:HET-domain-containing protein [Ganoderma leucocontextum]